jgi:hypothetical protein
MRVVWKSLKERFALFWNLEGRQTGSYLLALPEELWLRGLSGWWWCANNSRGWSDFERGKPGAKALFLTSKKVGNGCVERIKDSTPHAEDRGAQCQYDR